MDDGRLLALLGLLGLAGAVAAKGSRGVVRAGRRAVPLKRGFTWERYRGNLRLDLSFGIYEIYKVNDGPTRLKWRATLVTRPDDLRISVEDPARNPPFGSPFWSTEKQAQRAAEADARRRLAAFGSKGVVRRGREASSNFSDAVVDALIDELREHHNAAGAMEVDGERLEGTTDQIALWGIGSDDRPFQEVYQILRPLWPLGQDQPADWTSALSSEREEEALVWSQKFDVGAKLLSTVSTGRGSPARRSRTGQELRAVLDTWNGDKHLSWNDVASQYGFESEAAAMLAVRRYATKYGLKVRRTVPVSDAAKRQQALVFHEAGLSNKDIAHRLGYRPTSVSSVLAAARRMRLLDKLYGKAKNPLRKKPDEGSRGVVRAGRVTSSTKTVSITYSVITEASLEAGDYADVGYYSGDRDFVSVRSIEEPTKLDVAPWVFTPQDAPYPMVDEQDDPHLATVRAVAAQILRVVGKEWPSTQKDPLPPRGTPQREVVFQELAEAMLHPDRPETIQILSIEDGVGLYYESMRRSEIDGSPIRSVDFDVKLEDGWRKLDVLRFLDLILTHHDAKAGLTR